MKFLERIRFTHVLAVLLVGLGLLIAGAITENAGVQRWGIGFVFAGALIYLVVRRNRFVPKDDE